MPPAIRLAVFGHPVAHSLSPRIHAAFGRQLGLPVEYRAIEATADAFGEALERFAAAGGVGANVTLPLKELAFERADRCTARARRAGAVNTLRREAGAWLGDNTDGAGLVRDLRVRHGLELRGLRTLVIGAGGAARGVAPALLDAGIAGLTVANRTFARAAALAEALDAPGRVLPRELGALDALGPFDLIVNASSAARGGALPDLPDSLADAHTVAVDLGYGEAAVPFLAWAQARGAGRRIDGLGMLVEQAADSFALWCGVRPGTDAIHAALSADTAARPTGT